MGEIIRGHPAVRIIIVSEGSFVLPLLRRPNNTLEVWARVYMTRRSDTAVGISDRVQFANQLSADVLVSIHLNASELSVQRLYAFTLAEKGLGEAEARLMKFESLAPVSLKRSTQQRYRSTDLEDLLFDLTINRGQVESVRLADAIPEGLSRASPFPNKGIRRHRFTF